MPKGARGFATWAARGGFVNPASKGCVAHTPGASRRSTALAHFPRGTLANLGRIAPRERESLGVRNVNEEGNHVSRARCGILHAASQNRDPGFLERK